MADVNDDVFNRIIEIEVLPNITKALHSIVVQGYDTVPFAAPCTADIDLCRAKANELKLTLAKYIDGVTEIVCDLRGNKAYYFCEANRGSQMVSNMLDLYSGLKKTIRKGKVKK